MHRLPLIVLVATGAALAGCGQQQPEPKVDMNAARPAQPIVPRPRPPIDRPTLLAAVAEAASATASGARMPDSVRSLDGRQFELRIRFGCRGPSTELRERWLGWSFDPEERRIRVRAKPTISTEDPLVARFGGEEVEAVEGFWIPRPWLLRPLCPAAAAVQSADEESRDERQPQAQRREPARAGKTDPSGDQQQEPIPVSARIGIAQFFTGDDTRAGRRGMRAYEAGHTLAEGKAISSQGYNLVLSGRLQALPGRGVIQCSARDPDSPPECLVSAEFLRVWIEEPGSGEVIAEWGGG